MTATWWCEHALTADGLRHSVTVTADAGRITSVAADTAPSGGATVLVGLTVPGFANAHSHAFHRALRSRVQAERGTFWTWRDTMYRSAEDLDPERYHRLGRAVFAEMAQAGIAVVGEFHYVHHQPSGAPYRDANAMGEALMAAATDVGIRITLLDTLYLHGALDDRGYAPVDGVQRRFSDGDVDRWVQRVADLEPGAGQRVGAAIHSVRAVDPDAMARVADWAGSTDTPLHAHVSEQRAENDHCAAAFERTPTQVLADAGVLSSRFTAVHATHPTPGDIAILASSGSSVCLCPTTERDLGDGLGPVSDFVDAGVPICLGSDSHAVIDMLAEARAIELGERLRLERRGLVAADELMAMATAHGHRSLGWHDAGSIAAGHRADLTTISLTTERSAGAPDAVAVESAVFAAVAGDVTSVVVDGNQIVADGAHRTIDVAHELSAAIEELLR